MPKGPVPAYTKVIEPDMTNHVKASMSAGEMNPESGHYPELVITGISDSERALRIKRNLFNAAKRLKVSMSATIEALDDGKYQVRFRAINKAHARAYILSKYGSDRSKWAYDPRQKNAR